MTSSISLIYRLFMSDIAILMWHHLAKIVFTFHLCSIDIYLSDKSDIICGKDTSPFLSAWRQFNQINFAIAWVTSYLHQWHNIT